MTFKPVANKQNKRGFTLVELITVVAIVSLLVVYLTFELGSSNEDAKVAMSTTFLIGNVPNAIAGYKARHMTSCASLATAATGSDTTDANEIVKENLVASGLIETTPWGESWTASYQHAPDADGEGGRIVTINYPTTGADDNKTAGADIVTNLNTAPQVETAIYDEPNVIATYDCT